MMRQIVAQLKSHFSPEVLHCGRRGKRLPNAEKLPRRDYAAWNSLQARSAIVATEGKLALKWACDQLVAGRGLGAMRHIFRRQNTFLGVTRIRRRSVAIVPSHRHHFDPSLRADEAGHQPARDRHH
jgi:hypothetical protein